MKNHLVLLIRDRAVVQITEKCDKARLIKHKQHSGGVFATFYDPVIGNNKVKYVEYEV